ncbi:hypothetical protein Slin15195_G044300 [Septoria linicola]|uniref:Uncharacterized protein n=1 Tax=Septoria linicola TaxID=215465 RepID=A0A9Q9ASD0_9PEZI|nr:hypothetical protein Slin14017_G047820 [Septoria linicola]USW51111.1 hypothetical protein Slin15195_G044300 [Septoria linicola]
MAPLSTYGLHMSKGGDSTIYAYALQDTLLKTCSSEDHKRMLDLRVELAAAELAGLGTRCSDRVKFGSQDVLEDTLDQALTANRRASTCLLPLDGVDKGVVRKRSS